MVRIRGQIFNMYYKYFLILFYYKSLAVLNLFFMFDYKAFKTSQ